MFIFELGSRYFHASALLFLQNIKLTFAFRRAREFCTKDTGEILADVKNCESLNCNLRSRRGQSGDSYATKLYGNCAGQTANQLLRCS